MIIPRAVKDQYDRTYDLVVETGNRVRETLISFCERHGFLFEGRIKSLDSLAEKVETGRFKDWSHLDDFYACTIVVPLVSDEPAVLEFLQRTFVTIRLTQRGQVRKPPDVFRFDATRLTAKLVPPPGLSTVPGHSIFDIMFEVQVKTVFEFAWSKTTHALAYKSPNVDWRRLRLAAQLKAAIEQLDMLVLGFEQTTKYIEQGTWPTVQDQQRIQVFFEERVTAGIIPSEVAPKDWSRFSDNAYRVLQLLGGERPGLLSGAPLENLNSSLEILDEYFKNVTPEGFPRSISLLQLVVGVLVTSANDVPKRKDYFAPVTEELLDFFPRVAELGKTFDFQATTR